MAYFDVEESFYFEQKLAQLKALDPALYGNWEVAQVQAAFAEAGLSAQEHFDQYGWAEELSANATFDVAKYLAAKAAQLNEAAYEGKTDWTSADVVAAFQAAGLSAEAHFTQYGEAEGLEAQPVEGAPSTLTEALAKLTAANKAKADFLASVEIEGVEAGKVDEDDISNAFDAAVTAINTAAPLTEADYKDLTKQALQDTAMTTAKTKAEADVALATATAKPGMTALIAAAEKAKKEYTDAIAAGEKADDNLSAEEAAFDDINTVDAADVIYAADYKANLDNSGKIIISNGKAYTGVDGSTTPVALSALTEDKTVKRVAELEAAKAAAVAAAKSESTLLESLQKAVGAIYVLEAGGHSIANLGTAVTAADGTYSLTAGDVDVYKTAADAKVFGVKQELTVGAATTDGDLTVDGVTVAVLATDTAEAVASKIAAAFETSTDWVVKASGAKVTFSGQKESLADLVAADFVASTTGVAGTFAANTAAPAADLSATNAAALASKLKTLKDLEEAISEFQTARKDTAELEALEKAITEATEAITDAVEDGGLGVSLRKDGADFTNSDDVYLFNAKVDDAKELDNFGLRGEDKIFFGESYKFVALGDKSIEDKVGDAAVLEIFWKQVGADVELYVEQQAFAGNVTGNNDDIITITLTGVTGDALNFDGSYLIAGTTAA